MDVVRNFLARYEQTREEELSLEEYLDLCKTRPAGLCHRRRAHARSHRRARDHRHPPRPAPVAHLRQQDDAHLSRVQGFLRTGRADRAGRRLLPACGAGAGRKEADPLPAGPGGRRQVVDRRAPEAADGAGPVLRAQGFARQRIAAGPVQQRRGCAAAGAAVRHRAAATCSASCRRGPSSAWKNSAATSASSRWSSASRRS